jgi:hypothetical protein
VGGEETNENFALALPKHGVMWHTWVRSKTEGGGGDFGRQGQASRATDHGLDGSQMRVCQLHGGEILASALVPNLAGMQTNSK